MVYLTLGNLGMPGTVCDFEYFERTPCKPYSKEELAGVYEICREIVGNTES